MVLYGAEAWGMRSAERKKVNVLEMMLWGLTYSIDRTIVISTSFAPRSTTMKSIPSIDDTINTAVDNYTQRNQNL